MSESVTSSIGESLGRWQVWVIAAGGAAIWGVVRSGAVPAFLRFLGRHPVTTTIISADLVSRMIEPATHIANVGSALIEIRSALRVTNQELETVLPILPDISTPHGMFEPDPQEIVLGSRRIISSIGIRGAFAIGRPLIQNRHSFQYLWNRWAGLHSSNIEAVRNARNLYKIFMSVEGRDFLAGGIIAFLIIGASELAWTLYFESGRKDSPGGRGPGDSDDAGGGGHLITT